MLSSPPQKGGQPMTDADDVELRRLAIRRADMKLAFRSHLMAYVIVNGGLVAIYVMTSFGHYFWPIWPMIGWGIGLGSHAMSVYMNGEGIRDRLIEEELEKLRRTRLGYGGKHASRRLDTVEHDHGYSRFNHGHRVRYTLKSGHSARI